VGRNLPGVSVDILNSEEGLSMKVQVKNKAGPGGTCIVLEPYDHSSKRDDRFVMTKKSGQPRKRCSPGRTDRT
jgi:hypothetical protein